MDIFSIDITNKAFILNQQFQSVYTKGDLDSLLSIGPRQYPMMNDTMIHEWGILTT
jgi:hypothetical protein